MIEIVSATRLTEDEFWSRSALGISLARMAWDKRIITWITYENKVGLSTLYNDRIAARNGHDTLVFIHDDVWIDDYFFGDRVMDGCAAYDIIGVAGNRAPLHNQPGWGLKDWSVVGNAFTLSDPDTTSGVVGHGPNPFSPLIYFGPVPAECELLDGLLLAASKRALLDSGTRFDPQFDFHFYDLDFCRTARARKLRLGTWPIALTHQSTGGFGSKAWIDKLVAYRAKWTAG